MLYFELKNFFIIYIVQIKKQISLKNWDNLNTIDFVEKFSIKKIIKILGGDMVNNKQKTIILLVISVLSLLSVNPTFAKTPPVVVGSHGTPDGIAMDMSGAIDIAVTLGYYITRVAAASGNIGAAGSDAVGKWGYVDTEVTSSMLENDIIIVGGPVANSVTRQLVDEGRSMIDWYGSNGDVETITASNGHTICVVAGRNREATQNACRKAQEMIINRLAGALL